MRKGRIFLLGPKVVFEEQLKEKFQKAGFELLLFSERTAFWKEVRWSSPDLVILDRDFNQGRGLEFCKKIRENIFTAELPIIFLSQGSSYPEQIIAAYENGADDYVKKPFNQDVLLARIKAILWRVKKREEEEEILKSGNILLNRTRHRVSVGKRNLHLTPKEFNLLFVLMKKRGHLLTREFLCENVWEYEYFRTTRTVDYHIAQLRQKLGKEGKRIKTVEKLGYIFE
jgi:two-component system alkaline phosphatase synthesis response regulator PhoP